MARPVQAHQGELHILETSTGLFGSTNNVTGVTGGHLGRADRLVSGGKDGFIKIWQIQESSSEEEEEEANEIFLVQLQSVRIVVHIIYFLSSYAAGG